MSAALGQETVPEWLERMHREAQAIKFGRPA